MNVAIIIAGGVGSRTGQSIPKQFLTVREKPIIIYTLEKFEACTGIDEIYVAVREEYAAITEDYIKQFKISKVKGLVEAGDTRNMSICSALTSIEGTHSLKDTVIIHHANMPFVSTEEILNTINAVDVNTICFGTIPQYDYMCRPEKKTVEFIDREGVKQIRVPEGMTMENALKIYVNLLRDEESKPGAVIFAKTDNRAVRNLQFKAIDCSCFNFKITTFEDLQMARAIILNEEYPK